MKTFLAFSGGKDSTALALLYPNATPVFTDTGWEFDELYAHIDKFEKVTGREVIRITSKHGSLPNYIRKTKFMPSFRARFCTRLFKIEPYNEFISSQLPAELLIGLRADEPLRVGNKTELEGLNIRYPLQEKGLDIFDVTRICLEYNLLPRYPVYMARGGCKGCFYKRKSEIRAMNHLIPETLEELRELEEEVQDERSKFAVLFAGANVSIADIQKQNLLFAPEEVYSEILNTNYGDNCGLFCNR